MARRKPIVFLDNGSRSEVPASDVIDIATLPVATAALAQAGVDTATVMTPASTGSVFAYLGAYQVNVLSVLAQASATTDYTAVITAIIASGKVAYLPNTGTPYLITGTLAFAAGGQIMAAEGAQIAVGFSSAQVISVPSGAGGVRIQNVNWVAATGVTPKSTFGTVAGPDFRMSGGTLNGMGCLFVSGTLAVKARVFATQFLNGLATALDFTNGANNWSVVTCEFQNNVGFGVRVDSGANTGLIMGCWCNSNGIELIGITYQGSAVRIVSCHAEGTGDNGISVTGYLCTITGCTAFGNAFCGIYLYGDLNTASGCFALNNGQVANPAFKYYNASNTNLYTGLEIRGGYGGGGQGNTMVGNTADDSQATPTQAYCGQISTGNVNWSAATAVGAGAIVYASGNLYQTAAGGTTGSTTPSHTSGSVFDGGVTWTFMKTLPYPTRDSCQNTFGPNQLGRYSGSAAFIDGTVNKNNTVFLEGSFFLNTSRTLGSLTVGGGLNRKVGLNWASGIAVTFGQLVYTNAGNILYRVINAGGATGSSAPTATSGTQTTADGIKWLALGVGAYFQQVQINQQDSGPGNVLSVPILTSAANRLQIFAGTGSPLNVVTANPGCLYLRSDGGAGTTFYVKESGIDATGWVAK